jgi:hypothetical protein
MLFVCYQTLGMLGFAKSSLRLWQWLDQ